MLASLIEFFRDLAVLVAAGGVAWWCWDQWRHSAAQRDEAARVQLAADRQVVDMRQWLGRLDERTAAMAAALDEIAADARAAESRAAAKLRVHRLLQATPDPFLSFAEIERGLGQVGRFTGALADEDGDTAEARDPLVGDALRRALIELVADGVLEQLNRDRYFIASDYDASEEGEGETPPPP